MIYMLEHEVEGDRIGPPYQRVIRHLLTPETVGTKGFSMLTSSVDPGFTSNAHSHEVQEEAFYCVSGQGRIRVDDEEMPLEPGAVAFIPPGCVHQLINDGDVVLKCVSVVAPPFVMEQYQKDHLIKK
jgi:quercetin dioxygenase-like cupin family protein